MSWKNHEQVYASAEAIFSSLIINISGLFGPGNYAMGLLLAPST